MVFKPLSFFSKDERQITDTTPHFLFLCYNQKRMLVVTFLALVFVFLLVVGPIFLPFFRVMMGLPFILVTGFSLVILGSALIFLALRQKVEKKLKKFLILTGASAIGFFIGSVLHNLLYAAAELTKNLPLLSGFFEILHAAFFLIAVFLCPIGFLVGAIGSAVFLLNRFKGKRKKRSF